MDVVELGQRERSGRGWAIGLAAVLLLGAGAYRATRPDPPAREGRPTPTPSASSPSHTAELPPEYVDPTEGDWRLPRLGEQTGLVVAGTSDGLLVMDLDTGESTHVPVPGDAEGVTVEAVAKAGDEWLVARRTVCGDAPCPPASWFLVRGTTVTGVGTGHTAHLDPDGRTLWTTTLPAAYTPAAERTLTHRAYTGRVLRTTTLRPFEEVVAVTAEGPVLGGTTGEAAVPLTVLHRATGTRRVLARAGRVVHATGHAVAWTSSECLASSPVGCRLMVTVLPSGDTPFGAELVEDVVVGAIDPTGRRLAVSGRDAGREVVKVYDVRTGGVTTVDALRVPPRPTAMRWSPDGRWLAMTNELYDGDLFLGHQVALYRADTGVLALAPVFPGASGEAFVLAPAG